MNAHYLDAIPVELLKEEQDRITFEMAHTEQLLAAAEVGIDQIESTMRRCLNFMVNCYETYVMAPPHIKRQLNQAVFEAFFVTTDGALAAKPTEWFQALLRSDALRPRGRRAPAAMSSELHHSQDWSQGAPSWLQATNGQKGRSRHGSAPVFSGLGLNKTYLAEEVGFEPTVA